VGGICGGLPQQVVAAGTKDSLHLGQTDKKAQMQTALKITLLNSKYIPQYGITTNFKKL
jgi:hypothetical protein